MFLLSPPKAAKSNRYNPTHRTPGRVPSPSLPLPTRSAKIDNAIKEIIDDLKTKSGRALWEKVPAELNSLIHAYQSENKAGCPCQRDHRVPSATDFTALSAAIAPVVQQTHISNELMPKQVKSDQVTNPSSDEISQSDANQDSNLPLKSVTLLRALKAYCYPSSEISFQRFTWLNLLNIVMYEDELMALDVEYAKNPGLILCPLQRQNLRNLLSEYNSALSAYENALRYEGAGAGDGLESRIKFERLAQEFHPGGSGDHQNPYLAEPSSSKRLNKVYDEMRIHPDETDRLRSLLNSYLPDSWLYTKPERELLEPVREWLFAKGNTRHYGHWTRIDKTARVLFGIIGIVSLLVPLVALTFIQNTNYRLLATTGFVITFTLVLAFLSVANNQELVGATAAYAAVLVVFVGSTIGSSSGSGSGGPTSNSTGSV